MHFTYEEEAATEKEVLRQGDLLRRTEAINQLLEKVHPHYFRQQDYRFLLVLTQSCDLERRNGECGTRYITIAAIRPLTLVLQREVDLYRKSDIEHEARIADSSYRQSIQQFVERLLNNNEARYFYLHEQPEAGLTEPHCAFLHLSIAVRAAEHYDTCLGAKFLQLKPEFQAKLGWLVGNLYSRVGTDDWVPKTETEDAFRGRVKSLVEQETLWVDRRKLQKLKDTLAREPRPIRFERVRQILEGLEVPSRRERVLERVRAILPQVGLAGVEVSKAVNLLGSDPEFSQLVKDR